MRLSVVFGTRGDEKAVQHLERIFRCLEGQTFQDFKVIVVVDRTFDDAEWSAFSDKLISWQLKVLNRTDFCTMLNSNFIPQSK
jgi:hypothetical protein